MQPYLTPQEVSERYKRKISVKTLANWRTKKLGPKWTKIGGRILYRLDHVIDWEKTRTTVAIIGKAAAALLGFVELSVA